MYSTNKQPVWKKIYSTLHSYVLDGLYKYGEKLPTENELAAIFKANRHTVRRALNELAHDGVISIRKGSGAYVIKLPIIFEQLAFNVFGRNDLSYIIRHITHLHDNTYYLKCQGFKDNYCLVESHVTVTAMHALPAIKLPCAFNKLLQPADQLRASLVFWKSLRDTRLSFTEEYNVGETHVKFEHKLLFSGVGIAHQDTNLLLVTE